MGANLLWNVGPTSWYNMLVQHSVMNLQTNESTIAEFTPKPKLVWNVDAANW